MAPVAAVLAAWVGAGLLAQAAEGETAAAIGDALGLVNYGILGVLFYLWVTRRIATAGEVRDADARTVKAEERAEAAEARERALADVTRAELVPAVVRFTDTAARMLENRGGA